MTTPTTPLAPLTEEEWRPVLGYEGTFEVSSHGRVRTVERIGGRGRKLKSRMLTQRLRKTGHRCVYLFKNGRARQKFVHSLMLEAFVCPRPLGMECRHLDGIPSNNALINLRWGTRNENCADQIRHGVFVNGERSRFAKHTEAEVRQARDLYADGMTRAEIRKRTGIKKGTLDSILGMENWKHLDRKPGDVVLIVRKP